MVENVVKTTRKEHLKKIGFQKGDPRINVNGRPKGSFSLVEMIKHKLQEQAVKDGKKLDKTYADFFIEQLMKKAVIEGDVAMMRDMINRVDGLPKQSVDHTTGGEAIQFIAPSEVIQKNSL